MARPRSPNRDKAFRIWLDSNRQMMPKDIAERLGISPSLVRKWKSLDKWDDQPDPRPGAPLGNKNALGNRGGKGGPIGNDHAVTHGLFRKFLPDDEETLEIFDGSAELSTIDMLAGMIRIKITNIIRAQKIQFVRDIDDVTETLVGSSETTQRWQVQQAWDKQASALNSQASAMRELRALIREYEDALRRATPDELTEQRMLDRRLLNEQIKALEAKAW